MTEIEWKG